MRYLKLFEGRLTLAKRQQQETDLDEFTKIHLAYLADEGFDMYDYSNIAKRSRDYRGLHTSILISNHLRKRFTWEEIRDRFIPYLYMLNKEYNILEIIFYGIGYPSKVEYKYDSKEEIKEIISGEMDDTLIYFKNFVNIRIIIKG